MGVTPQVAQLQNQYTIN